jgi:hypothetical protein
VKELAPGGRGLPVVALGQADPRKAGLLGAVVFVWEHGNVKSLIAGPS